jgi:hypothetical protein
MNSLARRGIDHAATEECHNKGYRDALGRVSTGFRDQARWGLCGGGFRFKLELPMSEESIVAIIRNLCEIAQEGWLSEELLRRDAGQIAGWIVLGMNA